MNANSLESHDIPTDEISRRTLMQRFLTASTAVALGTLGTTGPIAHAASSSAQATPASPASDTATKPFHMRGVNLGGWLVLEKWMTPSVFAGIKAGDEYTLGVEMGRLAATKHLRAHRERFITESDFAWIADHGLNAVRLPVGYWVLEGGEPFVAGQETLDKAFDWATKHKLKVVLDLHGAPGSQNGNDHSGKAGPLEWHKKPENIQKTLQVLEDLAARYKSKESLIAIELLNEPRWDIPIQTLKSFYQDGYHRVRRHLPSDRVAVMFHDGFRPMEWKDFMKEPEYSNVILDTHIYQCFTDADRKRSAAQQIELAAIGHGTQIETMDKTELWTCVGEWSLGLPGESYADLSPLARLSMKRAYASAQLLSFERASSGWFFWNYKTESAPEWSLRDSVERGWFPENFAVS